MRKSYILNRQTGCVGQVGVTQHQPLRLKSLWTVLTMLVMTLLLGSQGAWAQGRVVTGKVTDPAGGALPGVSVQVKGTQRGTTSDADGKYSISNVPDNATLVLSFIGYTSQEIAVGTRTVVDVKLTDDTKALDEVVVVGYGTAKRKDLTGSVAQVTAKDFNAGVNPNPLQAIQGKVAGLVITQPSGDPNQQPTVRLRGYTSLAGGSDPLYVVDGMIGVPISTIAPQDIESMDVLKDASAAAIYGSRAANGVILITTKRGKSGKTTVSFNNYIGVSSISNRLDVLDGPGYIAAARQFKSTPAIPASGTVVAVPAVDPVSDLQRFPKDANGNYYNTDWIKEISRMGYINNHDLAISGGSPTFSYRGSLNYINQNGIIKNTGLNRLTGRINLDQKALDNRLNIQYSLSYSETNRKYSNDLIIYRALTFLPTLPVRTPTGAYAEVGGSFDLFNPVAMLENAINTGVQRYTQGGVNLRYEVLDGLTLGVNGQLQRDNTVNNYFSDPSIKAYSANNGRASRALTESNSQLLELTANYNKSFGEVNNFALLGGYSYQQFDNDGFGAANSGFVTSDINFNNLGLGSGTLVNPGNNYATSYRNSSKLISFFGRATLNMNDRYNLTATVRRDGSSKFGINNKWGIFPSIGAGWTITNESFFPKSNTLNLLKLRVGYGQTGNQEGIAPYNSIQLYGQKGNPYYDGTLGDFLPSYGISQNANPNLKWEVLTTSNVGLDFQLLNGRFSGTVEYYNKLTKDMLYPYSVPADGVTYFTNTILANVGSMRNSGFELSFGGDILQKGAFSWNSRLVAAYNKNEIVSLSNDQFNNGQVRFNPFGGRGLSDVYASYLVPGQPLGEFNNVPTFVGYNADGQVLLKPGKGDTPVTAYVDSDAGVGIANKTYIKQGNPQPFLTGSFINTFRYKGFDVYFQLRGTFGNKILNNTRSNLLIPGSILETNMLKDVVSLPKNYGVNVLSTNYLESGSFVRFDNWQVGYNVPLPASKYISNARIYVGGNNLFIITKYKGIDPELQVKGDLQNNGSIQQAPNNIGLDYNNTGIYPKTRTFQLGLNLTF